MPNSRRILTIFLLMTSSVMAHMAMKEPPPFRHSNNPYVTSSDPDYRSPLGVYPCKGYHVDFGTPTGKSVASYVPGKTYAIELEGSAAHNGGSCQISLSYDRGKSFSVIQSYIGNCVNPNPEDNQQFPFTVPKNAPKGEAILAWTWFNAIGHREMYMNCAAVTIDGSGGGRVSGLYTRMGTASRIETGANLGPPLFVANIGNGCSTVEGPSVEFPNPGKVVRADGVKTSAPVGGCGSFGAGEYFEPGFGDVYSGTGCDKDAIAKRALLSAGLMAAAVGAGVPL